MKDGVGITGMTMAAVFFLISAGYAVNSKAETLKIGVINSRKVMDESATGKKVKAEIEKKKKELTASLKKEEDTLQALGKEIEQNREKWSEEKLRDKQMAYEKKKTAFEAHKEEANLELRQLQEKKVTPVLKKFKEVVLDESRKGKYTLVLPTNAILYRDDGVDISQEMIKGLDKAMK